MKETITEEEFRKILRRIKETSITPTLGVIAHNGESWIKPTIWEAIEYWLFKHKF